MIDTSKEKKKCRYDIAFKSMNTQFETPHALDPSDKRPLPSSDRVSHVADRQTRLSASSYLPIPSLPLCNPLSIAPRLRRTPDIIPILDRDTLRLQIIANISIKTYTLGIHDVIIWLVEEEEKEEERTYHMIDLVNTNQSRRQFKHVIPQRNDNKLCVLGAFFDVGRYDRYLFVNQTLSAKVHTMHLQQVERKG